MRVARDNEWNSTLLDDLLKEQRHRARHTQAQVLKHNFVVARRESRIRQDVG